MFARAVLLLTTSAIAGCASAPPAPVVYGDSGQSTARIYNAPADSRQRSAYDAPAPAASRQAVQGPASLAPVAYRSADQRGVGAVRSADAMRPIQVAQIDPLEERPGSSEAPGVVTVRAGETVYAISRRTGVAPQAIIALNRLNAPYTLSIGQTLRVPGANPLRNAALPATQVSIPSTGAQSAVPTGARTHIVRGGETLYAVSRSSGVPVDDIIKANRLRPPYMLNVGDKLKIPGDSAAAPEPDARPPAKREAALSGDVAQLARNVSYTRPAPPSEPLFDWPVKGAIIGSFGSTGAGRRNDGINIAAPVGTPIRAAADGEVVYRGAELEGYGNLLLLKHDDGFVTAYAHNDVMLVRKGQKVRKGQVIGKVGQTGSAGEPQLHFEIRQNLKSVDPLAMLSK